MRPILISLALMLVVVSRSLVAQDRQALHGPGEVRGLPFSSAVRVGNMLYLSGQIGNVPATRQLADTGIAGQTRQALENIKGVTRRIHPHAPRWPGAGSRWARGWRSSVWRWRGRRGLSQGQDGAQASGPEDEHPAHEPALERAEPTLEDPDPGEESSLERREARLELRSQFGDALLELCVEAREIQFVELTQLGSIRRVHLIEPIDELVGELVPELLVELPGQLRRHRQRVLLCGPATV